MSERRTSKTTSASAETAGPCSEGWTGVDCDAIQCNGHGTPNYDLTSCHCEKPYSGMLLILKVLLKCSF
ncbi:hypothetical protein COOONC_19968 [Cooperia oncophora]